MKRIQNVVKNLGRIKKVGTHSLLVCLAIVLVAFSACRTATNQSANNTNSSEPPAVSKKSSVTEFKTQTGRPDISIDSYKLIAAYPEAVKVEAEAVMEVKKKFPLAMRTKDRALFEEILARDFTFHSHKNFFNREDYINDRTAGVIENWSVK